MSNFHKITVLLVIFIFFSASGISAETYTTKVIGIKDGDTISVLHEGKEETIRLNGIDCPEKKQAFGSKIYFDKPYFHGKI